MLYIATGISSLSWIFEIDFDISNDICFYLGSFGDRGHILAQSDLKMATVDFSWYLYFCWMIENLAVGFDMLVCWLLKVMIGFVFVWLVFCC